MPARAAALEPCQLGQRPAEHDGHVEGAEHLELALESAGHVCRPEAEADQVDVIGGLLEQPLGLVPGEARVEDVRRAPAARLGGAALKVEEVGHGSGAHPRGRLRRHPAAARMPPAMTRLVFWTSLGALAWTHAGYALRLALLRRLRGAAGAGPGAAAATGAAAQAADAEPPPRVSLIVAAYNEEAVIADKVADALALDWPRDRLELIVAVDGGGEPGADRTAELARAAGADRVLELPRGGKIRAQDAAVRAATGDLLAFSDANARWAPDALRRLAGAFADPAVGYACGQVSFVNEGGTNQEGLYWRYELWLRGHESALASVTAGNGAIYAVRPDAYIEVDPVMGHDLSLPFNLVKRGWRAVEVPARATEKMVPSIEGEWRRKRRMMSNKWPGVPRGGARR